MNLRRSCLLHNYARHVYPQLLPAFLLIITIIAVSCVAFLFPLLELLNIHTDVEKDQKSQLHITFFFYERKPRCWVKDARSTSCYRGNHRACTFSCHDWLVVVCCVRLGCTLPPPFSCPATVHCPHTSLLQSRNTHVFLLVSIFLIV